MESSRAERGSGSCVRGNSGSGWDIAAGAIARDPATGIARCADWPSRTNGISRSIERASGAGLGRPLQGDLQENVYWRLEQFSRPREGYENSADGKRGTGPDTETETGGVCPAA